MTWRAPRPSEFDVHRAVVQMLARAAAPGVIWYHPANGEKRNPVIAAKLRLMGVVPGVADLALVLPGGRAAFLEIKRPGGRMSEPQAQFQTACIRSGALYAVAHSVDEARDILAAWGALRGSEAA